MPGGRLADILLKRYHRVANQVGEALCRSRQHLVRWPLRTERDADWLEGVVGAERVDRLLAVDSDFVAGDLELDLAGHQQRRNQIA